MRVLAVAAALLLAACGDLDSITLASGAPPPRPTIATAAPAATSARSVLDDEPTAIGADPAVGVLARGCLGQFEYDGATGTVRARPQGTAGSRASPSGRLVLEQRDVTSGGIIQGTELWLVDRAAGGERPLYVPPPFPPGSSAMGATAQPNPNVPPYPFQRTEHVGPWSPDERYLAIWAVGMVSASMDADGRPLLIVDVRTGALTELGPTLLGNAVLWRAPHTLAYVAGGGRETWNHKTLRVWTPETGSRAITGAGEIGIAPAWGADGRLWFVHGAAGEYDVPTYFSGRGIGDRSLVGVDLATGTTRTIPRAPGYADEGVRFSDDGRLALILRRRIDPAPKTGVSPNSWTEIWSARPDGSGGRGLVRASSVNGFGYYGGYCSLASMEWRPPVTSAPAR